MSALPSGTITFLFTDIEGSTSRWENQPAAMQVALDRHDAIVRQVITSYGGHVFKTIGDGFCAAFTRAPDALAAALAIHRALADVDWSAIGGMRVRMALHTGTSDERDGDYFGPPLNRVARLLSAGHGGHILVSAATQELVRDALPEESALQEMGLHHLKDLLRPERIYRLTTADLPVDLPPLRSLAVRPNNLPVQRAVLLGREHELAALQDLLLRETVGLVTLTGPGGIGKTRLAVQVAAELLDAFSDGVWLVDLAPISDPGLVVATIARTLGIGEVPGQPLMAALAAALEHKRLLLLLDNFEQVVAAASVVADILMHAAHVKVLATSRSPLHLHGEQEYPIPPLATPNLQPLPPLTQLPQYDAVALFIRHAQMVAPAFQITAANAPAVAAICVQLDGLPLAIELAAARTKIFAPQVLLPRLMQQLTLVSGGARDLPARHQTLRATIEWSYNLLEAPEQRLFAELGVFVGGCSIAAVEAVCGVGAPSGAVFDTVVSLVDKSLLRQEPVEDLEPRFSMLETVRVFARERLAASEIRDFVSRAHAMYYFTLVEAAKPTAGQPSRVEALQHLAVEQANIRAALEWSAAHGDLDTMFRLCGALGHFWSARGYWTEGHHWLQAAVARGEQADQREAVAAIAASTRAKVLRWAAHIAADLGAYATARAQTDQALALYRMLDDKLLTAMQLHNLAYIADRSQNGDDSNELWEETLELYREIGAHGLLANVLNSLGWRAFCEGDMERARMVLEESVAVARACEEPTAVIWPLTSMGMLLVEQGDHLGAQVVFAEGLRLAQPFGHRASIQGFLDGFACLAARTGNQADARRAARLFAAAATTRSAVGILLTPEEDVLQTRYHALAHTRLSSAEWTAAWAEGQAMSLEQAVAYALDEGPLAPS